MGPVANTIDRANLSTLIYISHTREVLLLLIYVNVYSLICLFKCLPVNCYFTFKQFLLYQQTLQTSSFSLCLLPFNLIILSPYTDHTYIYEKFFVVFACDLNFCEFVHYNECG